VIESKRWHFQCHWLGSIHPRNKNRVRKCHINGAQQKNSEQQRAYLC
jgi:hypothetical protein